MSTDDRSKPEEAAPPPTNAARRPYASPIILSEQVFETLALSCGKDVDAGCGDILPGPLSS